MKFLVDKQDQYVVVEVQEEEINSMNAPKLKSEFVFFNTEGYQNIILDLKLVKFIDSSGLSAILVGNRLCKDSNGIFAITNIGDQVGKLIKISQLENILNIYSSTQEAKDSIDKLKNE
jgi:anti-anti-sigma factor